MSWTRFFRKHSGSRGSTASSDWYERLADLFRRKRGKEFTFEHLYQKVNPPSVEALAAALTKLTDEGLVHQIVRVESPTKHGSIGDYPSIEEIPLKILDWRADEEIRVTPGDLRVLYTP